MHLQVMKNIYNVKRNFSLNESIFSEEHTIVEPLIIPDGSKPGDRIFVEGNQGTPDDQLNPKKKVFVRIKAN